MMPMMSELDLPRFRGPGAFGREDGRRDRPGAAALGSAGATAPGATFPGAACSVLSDAEVGTRLKKSECFEQVER